MPTVLELRDIEAGYGPLDVLFSPGQQLLELRRVDYDIWSAQDKIVDAGLPQRLADRLALGK